MDDFGLPLILGNLHIVTYSVYSFNKNGDRYIDVVDFTICRVDI